MANKPVTYTRFNPNRATKKRVIDALASLGDGWHDGRAIAAAIGRNKLYPSDRGVLARLVADGTLETRTTPVLPTMATRYEYHVIGKLPGAAE